MAPNKSEKSSRFPKWSLDDKPVKVDKWDGSAVKNALDDAVRKVFTEKFHYTENHRLMDGRLGICFLAVGVAMLALAWDYFYPFPQSRPVLIASVASYFLLMAVLTAYTTFTEKGIFLVAVKKDKAGIDPDTVWHVSSQLKRFDDMYHLVVSCCNSNKGPARETKLQKSVAMWFDENGVLVFNTFEEDVSRLHNSLLLERKEK